MTTPEPIVLIVDDDPSVSEALTALFRSVGLRALAFPSAQAFLQYPRPEGAACLVLDVRLPGLSGLELQRELRTTGDAIPVVFITGPGDVPMCVGAMKGGAVEFLLKPFDPKDLIDAVRQALARDSARRLMRAELNSLTRRYATLTTREREVMAEVVRGQLNKQIAAGLGVAEITIKVHRRHLMGKMGAASLVDLVRMAERLSDAKVA